MNVISVIEQAVKEGLQLSIVKNELKIENKNKLIPEDLLSLINRNEEEIFNILKEIDSCNSVAKIPIKRYKSSSFLTMSIGQERLWYINKLSKNKYIYNHQTEVRIRGSLHTSILIKSIQHVIEQHEILRTNLSESSDFDLIQVINDDTEPSLDVIDLRDLYSTKDQPDKLIKDYCLKLGQRNLDLSKDKLVMFSLLKLHNHEYSFVITMHHTITDGWSFTILLDLIWDNYKCLIHKKELNPPNDIQYADFSIWQKTLLFSNLFKDQIAYWKKQLADIPPSLKFPREKKITNVKKFTGEVEKFTISEKLTNRIKKLGLSKGVITPMILISALYMVIMHLTGRDDICIGMPVSYRHHPQLSKLIGFFVNTVVLRLRLTVNSSFNSILSEAKRIFLEAYKHQDIPFDRVVETINPHRNINSSPLFQIMFSYQNIPMDEKKIHHGLSIGKLHEHRVGAAKFDLNISITENNEILEGFFEYSNERFDKNIIKNIIKKFNDTLCHIVEDPNIQVNKIYNQATSLKHINSPSNAEPYKSIIAMIIEQSHHNPNLVAVNDRNKQYSYEELIYKSEQLSNYLSSLGVKPNTKVALHLEKSVDIITAIIAILMCGACYVPIDPKQPDKHKNLVINDSDASYIIIDTKSKKTSFMKAQTLTTVNVSNDRIVLIHKPKHNLPKIPPSSLAYIMYTSGTTGIPKGVQITHESLSNLVMAYCKRLKLHAKNRILQYAPIFFDVSVADIFSSLASGSSLYLTSKEEILPGPNLGNFINKNKITDIHLTPSIFSLLPDMNYPYLNNIILGGEIFSYKLIRKWIKKYIVFNSYGATETTVSASLNKLEARDIKIIIDNPIDNCKIYIVDDTGNLVTEGMVGEICISGKCLANGYLNRAVDDKIKFTKNSFSEDPNYQIIYKTGDLAKLLKNGKIELIGRNDNQVKINGRRIELSEISQAFSDHPDILASVVLPYKKNDRDILLIAYILSSNDEGLEADLKKLLKQSLPTYMIPKKIIIMNKFPLTENGKVKISKLPQPQFNNEFKTWHDSARSEIEYNLTSLWKELLGLESIGINDSFFDLGGHSLLSLKLLSKIKSIYKKELELSKFIKSPTISFLSQSIQSNATTQCTWTPLIELQTSGRRRPLFCIHPAGGTVFCYADLASQLKKFDRPLYGLQARGLKRGQSLIKSIKEMAILYSNHIRNIQPTGTYHILGWSAGGTIAYEVAQQLVHSGYEVNFLGILDTYAAGSQNSRFRSLGLDDELELLARIYLNGNPYDELPNTLIMKLHQIKSNKDKLTFIVNQSKVLGILPQDIASEDALRLVQAFKNDCIASRNYIPKRYSGTITLFIPEEKLCMESNKPVDLGWGAIPGNNVEIYKIPGNHMNMLYYPNAILLGAQIDECIKHTSTVTS